MAQDAVAAQAEIAKLRFQLASYRRAEFGRSSEQRKRSVKSACRRSRIEAMMGGWQRQQTECSLTA